MIVIVTIIKVIKGTLTKFKLKWLHFFMSTVAEDSMTLNMLSGVITFSFSF